MTSFEVVRSTTIDAPRSTVHALIDDFHRWREWSPWEDVDPDLRRTYSGAESGTGAHYAWAGNRKAGEGSMEILSSAPEAIGVELRFLKPWKATNQVAFRLEETDRGGTHVDWVMTGEQTGLMGLLGRFVPMEKFVGKDFEKGLAQLKSAAESA